MPMFKTDYLEKLEAYFASGDLEQDFEFADEEKRGRILEFLEKLMDLADKADELATRLIFKGQLDMMLGGSAEGESGSEGGGESGGESDGGYPRQ